MDSLEKAIEVINQHNLAKRLSQIIKLDDEIKSYSYLFEFNRNAPFFEKNYVPGLEARINSSGLSCDSEKEAIIRCVSEFIERFSLFFFDPNILKYSNYKDLSHAVNPSVYKDITGITDRKINWIEGIELHNGQKIWIPAQLIYINSAKEDINLSVRISTGAASYTNKTRSILKGIYEIIERDAFMTTYLTRSIVPRIDIETIKNNNIQSIYEQTQRYNLEICLFDITNDINIPSYLCILIDRTGIGPAIVVGAKSSINPIEAVEGSLEEAIMARSWIRGWMMKRSLKKIEIRKINNKLQRAQLWANIQMIQEFEYILNQKKVPFKATSGGKIIKELEKVVTLLNKKGFNIYYKNITHEIFRNSGFTVTKSIIPGMQPLYLDEVNTKEYKMERLLAVSKYFNQKELSINQIPHPML